ncbi:hypothetical protein D3C83_259300 [compost metagenome]
MDANLARHHHAQCGTDLAFADDIGAGGKRLLFRLRCKLGQHFLRNVGKYGGALQRSHTLNY